MKRKPSDESASGFICLSRKFFEHRFWEEHRPKTKAEAWIDLIQMAWYRDVPAKYLIGFQMISYNRGEMIASYSFLAERWLWHKSCVRRFLDLLEAEKMISKRNVAKVTIIALTNFETYNRQASNSTWHRLREKSQKIDTIIDTITDTPNIIDNQMIEAINDTMIDTMEDTIEARCAYNIEERNNKEIHIQANKKNTLEAVQDAEKFKTFISWIDKKAPDVNKMKLPFTLEEFKSLRAKYRADIVEEVLLAMQNRPTLLKDYKSAYLTCTNWCKRRKENPQQADNEQKKMVY